MGPPTRYGNGHSPVLIKYTAGTHFRECELSLHSFFFVLTNETESFFPGIFFLCFGCVKTTVKAAQWLNLSCTFH